MSDINLTKLKNLAAVACLVLTASVISVSCVSAPERDRGSLSDAMDKARDDHEGSRSVPDEPAGKNDMPEGAWIVDPPRRHDRDRGNDSQREPLIQGSTSDTLSFGFRSSVSLASSEDWASPLDMDMLLGSSGDSMGLFGYLGLRVVDPGESSPLSASIKDSAGIVRAGFQFRWYPLSYREYLSPLIDFSIGGFTMGWTYRNALTAGNDTILGDSLGGLHLALGAGVSIVRGTRAEFSVRLVPEAYLFGDKTDEGFTNDFFKPLGVLKLEGELIFR